MSTSKLKLNPDKTEFIIFGSKRQRDKLKACFPIDVLGSPLSPVDSVRNLGVWFDSDFSLSKHVQNVCKSCFVVGWITATHFLGASPSSIYVNYSASKIVQPELYLTPVNIPVYITPVLNKLHWLPVEKCMMFKTATLDYKFLHTGFPRYFAPYLSSYSSSYSTRLSQSGGNFLVIPKLYPSVHKSVKQFSNSFAFDAHNVWNALPDEIHASPSLASFRKQLKTYQYTKAYPP